MKHHGRSRQRRPRRLLNLRGSHCRGCDCSGRHPLQQTCGPHRAAAGQSPARDRFLPWCVCERRPYSYAGVTAFTSATGAKPDVVMYYSGWYVPFPTGFATTAANEWRGAARADGPGWHQHCRHRFRAVRRLPERVRRSRPRLSPSSHPELRPRNERLLVQLGLPEDISRSVRGCMAAYRQTLPRARAQERDLAVDGQHHQRYTRRDIPRPNQWWPGSSYVNWVGIDGYYLKPSWKFAPLFGPTIGAVRALTGDPILIAETGAVPAAGQPAKIADLFAGIRQYGLLGFVWFDSTNTIGQDFGISSPAATRCFPKGRQCIHQAWVMNGPAASALCWRQKMHGGATVSADTEGSGRHRQAQRQRSPSSGAPAPAETDCIDWRCSCSGGSRRYLRGAADRGPAQSRIPRHSRNFPLPTTPGSYVGLYPDGVPDHMLG